MLKLSKMTDYAVIILAEMAGGGKTLPLSASVIAQRTRLPEPTVSKILKRLSQNHIVAATRGVNGGYSLQKESGAITMAMIVKATDGPVALTACVEKGDVCCDRADHCQIKGKWDPVNRAMIQALEGVSLLDMTTGKARV